MISKVVKHRFSPEIVGHREIVQSCNREIVTTWSKSEQGKLFNYLVSANWQFHWRICEFVNLLIGEIVN
jgi:hypothetical protein